MLSLQSMWSYFLGTYCQTVQMHCPIFPFCVTVLICSGTNFDIIIQSIHKFIITYGGGNGKTYISQEKMVTHFIPDTSSSDKREAMKKIWKILTSSPQSDLEKNLRKTKIKLLPILVETILEKPGNAGTMAYKFFD